MSNVLSGLFHIYCDPSYMLMLRQQCTRCGLLCIRNMQGFTDNQLVIDWKYYEILLWVDHAIERGFTAGKQVINLRTGFGASSSVTMPGGREPGAYRTDFTSAQYAAVIPFTVSDSPAFRIQELPVLQDEAYAVAFNDVRGVATTPYTIRERKTHSDSGREAKGTSSVRMDKTAMAVVENKNLPLSAFSRSFALSEPAPGDVAGVTGTQNQNVWFDIRPLPYEMPVQTVRLTW